MNVETVCHDVETMYHDVETVYHEGTMYHDIMRWEPCIIM